MKSFGVEDHVKEPGWGGHCFRRNYQTHVGQLVFPSQVHSQLCFYVFFTLTFAPKLPNRRLPAQFFLIILCSPSHCAANTRLSVQGGRRHLENHTTLHWKHISPQDTSDYAALWSQMKKQQDHFEGAVASVMCSVRHACWQQPGGQSTLYSDSTFWRSSDPSASAPTCWRSNGHQRWEPFSLHLCQRGQKLTCKAEMIQSLVSQSVRVRTEHTAVHRGEPIVENPSEERCRRWCCSLCSYSSSDRWTLLSGR